MELIKLIMINLAPFYYKQNDTATITRRRYSYSVAIMLRIIYCLYCFYKVSILKS